MAQILTHQNLNVNSNSPVSCYTFSQPKKELKLHSSDIAYLEVLAWFRLIGKPCYLNKKLWPEWLVRFGGKAIHYTKQKERWAKMKALGYITMHFQNGNRNLHMIHKITPAGLQALEEWKIKNGTSKYQKRTPEKQKTVPPLKFRSKIYENHENDVFDYPKSIPKSIHKSPPVQHPVIDQLKNYGVYEGCARRLFLQKGEKSIIHAIEVTKTKKANNPGAYIVRMLDKPIFDCRQYNLEEKSESLKREESSEINGNIFDYIAKIKDQLRVHA